jgi:tagatose 1,6-diphosphate aldolase
MTMTPGKQWGLRRLADDAGRFKMVAVDQRPPIKDLVSTARGGGPATYDDVSLVKRLLVEELAPHGSAVLLDPHFAYPKAIDVVPPRGGLLLTLEDSLFEETDAGRKSSTIDDWSVDKIKRIGGDAVKVLAWYRPDASDEVIEHQQEFVAKIGEACRVYDIPFLFELLVYSFPGEDAHTTGYVEQSKKRSEHVLESIETFARPEFGVDVFKLESPIPAPDVPDPHGPDTSGVLETQALFDEVDRTSPVPWVMLSAGASKGDFKNILAFAYKAGASGFLAGRAIWWDELLTFPDVDRARLALRSESAAYLSEINAQTDADALPYREHRSFNREGASGDMSDGSFRHGYGSITG